MASPITIRLATPEEGPLVYTTYLAGGGVDVPCLDWSSVYPYWLLGLYAGVPVGTIMVSPGKPFGRTDFLYVTRALPKRVRALLLRDLSYAGVEACRRAGSTGVLSTIADDDSAWLRIALRRGWVPVCTGTFLLKLTT